METPQRIHMIAIAGVGMAALAGLLKKAGHTVTGSDREIFPPMSTVLASAGIVCKNGFHPNHIDADTDLVIIGNAVSRDNPEVAETLARALPYYSLPQALSHFFLKERTPLVVTGTHGKTTTTSQLAFVLAHAGRDPSVMVGGMMKNFNTNVLFGKGNEFVIEGDEYNSAFFDSGAKFLHYRPHAAIITSIEQDHVDIYPHFSMLQEAFRQFIRLIPPNGFLVAHHEPSVLKIVRESACPRTTYGLHPDADWQAQSVTFKEEGTFFDLVLQGQVRGSVQSPLMGLHNVKNTLATIALTYHQGLSLASILEGVRSFTGVARRQEIVREVRQILVLDDFAHHPTAIFETLSAIRLRYPTRRLWAVFEPRSASSRRNVFQKEFVTALQNAEGTVLADLFAPEKVPATERLNPREVVSELQRLGKEAYFIPAPDAIVSFLTKTLKPGDIVCVMSSGSFGDIRTKLADALAKVG